MPKGVENLSTSGNATLFLPKKKLASGGENTGHSFDTALRQATSGDAAMQMETAPRPQAEPTIANPDTTEPPQEQPIASDGAEPVFSPEAAEKKLNEPKQEVTIDAATTAVLLPPVLGGQPVALPVPPTQTANLEPTELAAGGEADDEPVIAGPVVPQLPDRPEPTTEVLPTPNEGLESPVATDPPELRIQAPLRADTVGSDEEPAACDGEPMVDEADDAVLQPLRDKPAARASTNPPLAKPASQADALRNTNVDVQPVQADTSNEPVNERSVAASVPQLGEAVDEPEPSAELPDAAATAPKGTEHTMAKVPDATPPSTSATTEAKPVQANRAGPTTPPTPLPVRPEAEFASSNHDRIVTSVRSELLPNGGTMHLRLDPPELGVLQVTVRMVDGAMTAAFQTSNELANRLLSHSLGQLKQALETQGLNVEKLHVAQASRDQQPGGNSDDSQRQSQPDGQSARHEQQRREMVRRMWARLGVGDPLDLVA